MKIFSVITIDTNCLFELHNLAMSSKIKNCLELIRPEVRAIKAYHVADANGLVKLDAMENPYDLPEELKVELQIVLSDAALNRYPDPSAVRLSEKLRQVMHVPDSCSIVLGNGSDELIQMLAMAIATRNDSSGCLLSFDPGFVMYKMLADLAGIDYVGVSLREDFSLDLAATSDAIEQHQPAIIFIAYPNNPSANCFSEKDIETILSLAPGLVVVDEAYHPFAQMTFMPRLEHYDNLLVMRTVSKMGLAGLRLGMLCGHTDIINEINKIRLPYNINVMTQIAAEFMLDNIAVLDQQAKLIRQERENMLSIMQKNALIDVFPSQANFILFRVLEQNADVVFDQIKQSGVLIKNMKADTGLLKNCLRVTVGKPEENQAFLNALDSALKKQ